ncbi:MAG: hypothetical protein H0V43_00005 [Gemmatimonadales bacterium]|nr:hypothetical protein [Gemmatimonadales bacterium]
MAGKRQGHGVSRWADGRSYEGEWQDDKVLEHIC